MKKRMTLFLVIALVCTVLGGCGLSGSLSPSVQAQEALPDMSSAPVTNPAQEGITYAVRAQVVDHDTTAEDGVRVASCHYELPRLQSLRADGTAIQTANTGAEETALEIAAAFNDKFTGWQEEDGALADAARADYQGSVADEVGFEPYELNFTYTSWQTSHFISIQATYNSYTGGAHPNTTLMAWNFDTDAGSFVDPSALAADSQEFQLAVKNEIIRQAQARAQEQGSEITELYWENYQDVVGEWTSYAAAFDGDGMMVGFSPYEIASYADGAQVFTLDNAFLKPYLSDYGRLALGLDSGT